MRKCPKMATQNDIPLEERKYFFKAEYILLIWSRDNKENENGCFLSDCTPHTQNFFSNLGGQ